MTTQTASELITHQQIQQYHNEGYCVVGDLFSAPEISEIEVFFEDYKARGGKAFDGGSSYTEIDPKARQVRAMHPHRHSKKAEGWMMHPNVVSVLETLLGSEPLGAQTMYYYKPPGAKGQGMHQDDFYLLTKPHACIAAWTAIDSADIENGCLYVVPGSHRYDIFCPDGTSDRWLNYGDSHISKFPRETKPIPVMVPKGHTMFFGGRLIHGSGPNRTTDRFRRTFIGHYIDSVSDGVAKFYHPIINPRGEIVSHVDALVGGGPCGDGWKGGVH